MMNYTKMLEDRGKELLDVRYEFTSLLHNVYNGDCETTFGAFYREVMCFLSKMDNLRNEIIWLKERIESEDDEE